MNIFKPAAYNIKKKLIYVSSSSLSPLPLQKKYLQVKWPKEKINKKEN